MEILGRDAPTCDIRIVYIRYNNLTHIVLKEEILSIKKEQLLDETTTNQKLEIATLKGQLEESRSMFSEIIKGNTSLFKKALEKTSEQQKEKPTTYSEVVRQKEKITTEKNHSHSGSTGPKTTAKEEQRETSQKI
ncbi:hypothetical protein CEXT_209661 [Caerostris extrusa]|uniref:Uncharacterized protein n=1 Tax=Caerostris extrusa TaxID=172846 RepID=A0AAV4PJX7_CAEEX|nr:hypothetical protein CEXT_209661 [Caerostris extrusa]